MSTIERRYADLRAALRVESLDRRTFLKVAGAAAVAGGLSRNAPVANAAPRARAPRLVRAQAAANTLVYGSDQDISNLDPHTGHDYSIAWAQRAVYDSILRYEGNPPELKPLLAKAVTGNDDATEWTIELVDNATFHDGSAVDAEAVKYNFDRMLRKNLGVAWMFASVMDENSAQVVDLHILKVTLTKPFAPFDAVLPWLFVANPKLVQEHEENGDEGEGWLRENAAGGGPFTIKTWEIGSIYEFAPYADYWWAPQREANPLDGFVWRIIRESSTKRIAMETGEINWTDYLTPEDVEALRANPAITVNDAPSLTPFALKLNNATGPTSDINVRKALSQAFDYDAALEVVLGRGALMEGPLPSNLEPWHAADLPVLRYDIEAAKASLAASQHPDGFELEYVYVTGDAVEENFGLILLDGASQLGINVSMTPVVWPDLVARAAKADTAPTVSAVYGGTSYVDPNNVLWQAYHSSQAGSWSAASWYQNPDLDKLLEDARSSTDQARRKELYDAAQRKLVEDAVEIWVYVDVANQAWAKTLGNPYTPVMSGDVRTIGFEG